MRERYLWRLDVLEREREVDGVGCEGRLLIGVSGENGGLLVVFSGLCFSVGVRICTTDSRSEEVDFFLLRVLRRSSLSFGVFLVLKLWRVSRSTSNPMDLTSSSFCSSVVGLDGSGSGVVG